MACNIVEPRKMDVGENIYYMSTPSLVNQRSAIDGSASGENNGIKKRCPVGCLLVVSSLALLCSLAAVVMAVYTVASSDQLSPSQLAISGSSLLNNLSQEIDALAKMVHNISHQQSRIANETRDQFDHQIKDIVYSSDGIRNLSLQTGSSIHNQNQQLQSQLARVQQLLQGNISMLQANISMLADQINILLSEIERASCQSGTFQNPARSCGDISANYSSGEYWITRSTNSPILVYCDINRTSCNCNTTGGWMRVANLNMTDPNQNCPAGFRLVTRTEPPLRACGRVQRSCVSTTYQTHGVEYSHVCGRIIGYQDGTTDAFHGRNLNIDSNYVDGISLTHGQSPRQHIWTFAAAADEVRSNTLVCPCTRPDRPYTGIVPSFIGQDYFCETGSRNLHQLIFYPDDPLWDGQGCGGTSTCCQFNNPPWFCKQLPQPTTDDIELRICGNEAINNEDVALEYVDIYIH